MQSFIVRVYAQTPDVAMRWLLMTDDVEVEDGGMKETFERWVALNQYRLLNAMSNGKAPSLLIMGFSKTYDILIGIRRVSLPATQLELDV